jgi:flagellar basal-body rod protein FlgC
MFNSIGSAIDISASGLSAERYRMEVIASNIANANATRSAEGGPYRRQQVVFATQQGALSALTTDDSNRLLGVVVNGISHDNSEFPMVYNPGHPDADASGMVAMPNVQIPFEMVEMITATRSYEANLRSIKSFREMAEQTLALLRGNR